MRDIFIPLYRQARDAETPLIRARGGPGPHEFPYARKRRARRFFALVDYLLHGGESRERVVGSIRRDDHIRERGLPFGLAPDFYGDGLAHDIEGRGETLLFFQFR